MKVYFTTPAMDQAFERMAQKLLGAYAAEQAITYNLASERQQAAIVATEQRDLIRTLRDETQSASVYARCVAIVGERS